MLDGSERALRFYLREGWTDTGRTQIERGPDDVELHVEMQEAKEAIGLLAE